MDQQVDIRHVSEALYAFEFKLRNIWSTAAGLVSVRSCSRICAGTGLLSVTSYSNRPRLSDGSLYIILERIKSLNELGGLDMGCVEYWWRKGRKLIADPNANVVERPHGLGLITRFPKFVGGFIKPLPWWKICFQVFHAYNSRGSSP
jgi:hypothetical protein